MSSIPVDTPGFTRRDFLKFLPCLGGALLLAGCKPPGTSPLPSSTPTRLDPTSTSPAAAVDTPSLASATPENTSTHTAASISEYLTPAVPGGAPLPLPAPSFPTDLPFQHLLQARKSSRSFRQDELPLAIISSLLWAGFGVNRSDGKRTAPSANNVQDMEICLVAQQGVFRYRAGDHTLLPLLAADLRSSTGTQSFVSSAPVDLVYVSDYDRIPASAEECLQWSWAHSGCIAQNIYLACALLGLATVVRSSINRAKLGAQLGLGPAEHITLSQTIGYPA